MPQIMPLPWVMVFFLVFFSYFSFFFMVSLNYFSYNVTVKKLSSKFIKLPW